MENVLLQIGGDYSKTQFYLSMDEAVQVISILRGKGVTFESGNRYDADDKKLAIVVENIRVSGIATKIDLPDQEEDEINDI